MFGYIISAFIGYVFGTSNMAYFIAKFKNIDIRNEGTGNLGASNATMVMGLKAGLLTLVHDFLKTIIAIVLCKHLFPFLEYVPFVAGASSILGHMFPFYLHFKGGKGFASYVGMLLAIHFKFALVMILIIIVVSFLADWIVAGTLSTMIIAPIYFYFAQGIIPFCILLVPSICMFPKHIENIKRKMNGQESSLRKALFKK